MSRAAISNCFYSHILLTIVASFSSVLSVKWDNIATPGLVSVCLIRRLLWPTAKIKTKSAKDFPSPSCLPAVGGVLVTDGHGEKCVGAQSGTSLPRCSPKLATLPLIGVQQGRLVVMEMDEGRTSQAWSLAEWRWQAAHAFVFSLCLLLAAD